jgi:hypothetical protein
VTANVTEEDVLTDGEKIQFSKVARIVVKNRDHLFALISGDRLDRGLSVVLRWQGCQAICPAGGLLRHCRCAAYHRPIGQSAHGIVRVEVSLEDLFLWGTDRLDTSPITSAWDVGPAEVGETTCEQYAFREPGLDWQIWLQKGDHPLPRKLVLTATTDDARPQHISVLTWNLAPSYNEGTFTFQPPDNAHKIIFASGEGTKQP